MKLASILLALSFFLSSNCLSVFAQNSTSGCNEWHNKIDPNKPLIFITVGNKTEDEIFFGIGCLLQLKGKKMDSNVGGAVRADVSEIFGQTPVEVAALFYISYLFYEEWQHADAPFLVDKNRRRNTDKTISKAYKAYRKWFKEVKILGLKEARKQKLDPLSGSGVSWY